jgi:single-stranded DNA-binding protein
MSLITAQGKGFLLTDGVELKFSKSGNAYARLPLVFKNSKKTPDGWVSDKEIVVEGTVFGRLAEYLCEIVDGRQELYVSGDIYTEEWEGKSRVKMNIHTAWPAKEGGRTPAYSSAAAAPADSDLPF